MSDESVSQLKGVGTKTAKSLEEAGRGTIKSLATANPDQLPEYTSLGEKKARDLVQKARKQLRGGNTYQSGIDIEEEQKNMATITTGSNNFDDLMKGGIPTNYTTEAYAKSSSGKTQIALQLSVNVQLPKEAHRCPECSKTFLNEEQYLENECCGKKKTPEDFKDEIMYKDKVNRGGLNQKAVFIDTEETFRADRVREMAEAQGLDGDEVLENIVVTRPTDATDQEEAITELRSLNLDEVGLIVIDSLMAHLRAEYSGRGEVSERQDRLGDILSELQKIASNYDIAVFYTNQAYDDPGQMFGDPTNAVGGNIMAHNSSFRLYLQWRGKKGYSAELVDSPNLPQEEIMYNIFPEGIRDDSFESEAQ